MTHYVWWTSQGDCEELERIINRQRWPLPGEEAPPQIMMPEYLSREYRARFGRNGRGRLWVSDQIDLPGFEAIPMPPLLEKKLKQVSCAGIIVRAEDVPLVFSLPGFVTTLDGKFVGEVSGPEGLA